MHFPVFLNEASYPHAEEDGHALEESISKFVSSLLELKRIRKDLVLGVAEPISDIQLTPAFRTMATVVKVVDTEAWRFLRDLEQKSPFQEVPHCDVPPPGKHVAKELKVCEAPLWVVANSTYLLSFPSNQRWTQNVVNFSFCACDDETHARLELVDVNNISCPEHVRAGEGSISIYGQDGKNSSLVLESGGFYFRIFVNDHNPPHVHVFRGLNGARCVGRVRIDQVEVLSEDSLTMSERRLLLRDVEERKDALLNAWGVAKGGRFPTRIV